MNRLELATSFAMMLMGQQKRPEDEVRNLVASTFPEVIDDYDAWLEERRRRTLVTSVAPEWRGIIARDQSKSMQHYPGPHVGLDVAWRATRPAIWGRIGEEPFVRIDSQSTDIVASLSDPHAPLARRRGLVVGHVQSGKTANYTASIAKAADWGYSLVIVLAGLHSTLRRQTQSRLDDDLVQALREDRREGDWAWHWLTQAEADFSTPRGSPDALLQERSRTIAVVKKNGKRLRSLVDWLGTADEGIRQRAAMLVIDDEADQASVNTRGDGRSAINELIIELLQVMPSASYVAFTATPYANVLIDPSDTDDLYPRDFIIGLPRPDGYQGSEVLFGRNELEGEEPVDGYGIVRSVPDEEVDLLVAPNGKEERADFYPEMTLGLEECLRWFMLATAARRARGQNKHSSCLVHTSRYVDQHFRLADVVKNWLGEVDVTDSEFRRLWSYESSVDAPPTAAAPMSYEKIEGHLPAVLADTVVAIDNGRAEPEQRLSYEGGPRTVIAVGGDTLSRGLTLEGLVSSFFVRRSRSYDALMQMGRWFGFRPGYEDLSRLWTDDATMGAFRHLSTVEEEIRSYIEAYSGPTTPQDLALRIRTHPAMAVTSANKMRHAVKAAVSYAGTRKQTTFFEVDDEDWLTANKRAASNLVADIDAAGTRILGLREGVVGWEDVDAGRVAAFLSQYSFHNGHSDLDSERILSWLRRRRDLGDPVSWNVVVLGRQSSTLRVEDRRVDLRTTTLGGIEFNNINRARLRRSNPADIGALMSGPDRVIDLPAVEGNRPAKVLDGERARQAPGRALLAIYPISPHSTPLHVSKGAREDLKAKGPAIGLGLVFPRPTDWSLEDLVEAEYVSAFVSGDDDLTDAYEEEFLRGDLDDEPDADVDVEGGS